jgi:hypothetical protein
LEGILISGSPWCGGARKSSFGSGVDGLLDGERSVVVLGALVLTTNRFVQKRKPAPGKTDLDFLPQPRLGGVTPSMVDEAEVSQGPTDNWFWTVTRRHGRWQASRHAIVSEGDGVQGTGKWGETCGIDVRADGEDEFRRELQDDRHDEEAV